MKPSEYTGWIEGQLEPDEVEIFRAGDYTSYGEHQYSENDVQEIVDNYDPKGSHEAPIILDHNDSGQAYGQISGLRKLGRSLVAKAGNVVQGFRDAFKEGRVRRASAEIYRDFEGTGKKYLRAVSFQGAKPPVVKGMALGNFHEKGGEFDRVEFRKPKNVRRHAETRPEEGDVKTEIQEAVAKAQEEMAAKFAEDRKSDAAKFEEARKADAARMEKLEKDLADSKRKANLETLHRFAEKCVSDNLITPAAVASGFVSFCEGAAGLEVECPVVDKDGKVTGTEKKNGLTYFGELLTSRKLLPPVGEVAGEGRADGVDKFAEGMDLEQFLPENMRSTAGANRVREYLAVGIPKGGIPGTAKFAEKAFALAAEKKISFEKALVILDRQASPYKLENE